MSAWIWGWKCDVRSDTDSRAKHHFSCRTMLLCQGWRFQNVGQTRKFADIRCSGSQQQRHRSFLNFVRPHCGSQSCGPQLCRRDTEFTSKHNEQSPLLMFTQTLHTGLFDQCSNLGLETIKPLLHWKHENYLSINRNVVNSQMFAVL